MSHHKLNECTFKLSIPVSEICGEPTRVCSVCGTHEFKDAVACCARAEFWLCPECLKKLKKLLDKSTES